jgi:hypothetical protein
LLEEDLAGSLVRDVSARRAVVDGLPVMAVRVDARLPVAGLVGPDILTVEAHALQEGWQ